MRRALLVAPVLGAVALAAFFALKPSSSTAEPAKGEKAVAAPRPDSLQLPIAQTVLFSSGVGYFQREGQIEGNARIDLSFRVEDINDLLKSMVLQDMNGGHVSAVSYESRDPIEKTLRSFAINLTNNPSFGQILNQARGEKVEVVLQQTGTIIGMEKQRQQVGKDAVVENELLNLWCAEGMSSVKLAEVQRIRFLSPVLDSEVKRAL